jgi:hypothetical protein
MEQRQTLWGQNEGILMPQTVVHIVTTGAVNGL